MSAAPEHAIANWPCPLGRTFGKPHENCIADACPLWRWLPVTINNPMIQSAIQREMRFLAQEAGSKSVAPYHKKAVAKVMENPADYSIDLKPDTGFCGLGGRP